MARIRVLGKMDLTEKKEAQDGRVTIKTNGKTIELRISVVPVFNGKRLAIRLMDRSKFNFSLQNLGIHKALKANFEKEIERPNGMVLVTGPTGSGKTTTLYSMIHHLNDSSRSIISIEDPVEYGFKGVGQIQVEEKSGFSFAAALRSVLRQDPNVIMVGEIRDGETAQIASRASLTGHMVLATLHTNDAPSAISRLMNMGVPPYLIASSLSMVVAQRLVRRLCETCQVPDPPNARFLLRMGFKPNQIEKLKFFKGKGCKKCSSTGYRGRMVIYEILFISEKMRELIATQQNLEKIRARAKKEKMITLAMDGVFKAKEGLTSLEEIVQQTQY